MGKIYGDIVDGNEEQRGYFGHDVAFSSLKGEIIVGIHVADDNNDQIVFKTKSGRLLVMWHSQECCEDVDIESIVGDLDDLIGEPILLAEEAINRPENSCVSSTWTFYKLATRKGYVDIRWVGESNGYYSETVDLTEIDTSQDLVIMEHSNGHSNACRYDRFTKYQHIVRHVAITPTKTDTVTCEGCCLKGTKDCVTMRTWTPQSFFASCKDDNYIFKLKEE